MKSWIDKVVVLLLSLFLISYGLYQGSRYMEDPYKTETAYEYTISDSCTGRGMFVRDEVVLETPEHGVANYLYEDATRVSEGMVIAEIFDDEQSASNQKVVQELEKEIAALKNIEVNTSVNYTGTEVISKQIGTAFGKIASASYSQIVGEISEYRHDFLGLINKKLIASNKIQDFEPRIAQLEAEVASLKTKNDEEIKQILSPMRGYFSSTVDGYEERLHPDRMKELTTAQCKEIIANPPKKQKDKLGKIMQGHDWYFLMVVSPQDATKFKKNRQLTLDFVAEHVYKVPGEVVEMREDETTGEAVAVISGNYILPEIIGTRVAEVNVNFRSYSGLRISSDAIRFVDNQKGVYVLKNMQIRFKAIDVSYEGNGFVLASPYSEIKNNISLYDEVVVEGVDLFDGKPVK